MLTVASEESDGESIVIENPYLVVMAADWSKNLFDKYSISFHIKELDFDINEVYVLLCGII